MDSPGNRAVGGDGAEGAAAYLAADEVMSAIDAMSEDDILRVMAIECGFLGGTGLRRGELYHEAVSRTLVGSRKCPREVPIIAYLIETMRSIASHSRARTSKEKLLTASDGVLDRLASDDPNPEQELLKQEDEATKVVREIEAAFEDDEQAQMLLMCWDDGLKGKGLRDTLGLEQAELDYLIKRVRRKVRKMYPTGWQQ